MCKYVIAMTAIVRQDVDGHLGTSRHVEYHWYVYQYHCITQKPVNRLTASYWLPVNWFWIVIRFTALYRMVDIELYVVLRYTSPNVVDICVWWAYEDPCCASLSSVLPNSIKHWWYKMVLSLVADQKLLANQIHQKTPTCYELLLVMY